MGTKSELIKFALEHAAREQIVFALLEVAQMYVAAYVRGHPFPSGVTRDERATLLGMMVDHTLIEALTRAGEDLMSRAGADAPATPEQEAAAKSEADAALARAARVDGNDTQH